MATKRAPWNKIKSVAAVVAVLSTFLLLTDLHTWVAQWFSMREVDANAGFTTVLSLLVVGSAVILYREFASLKLTVTLLTLGMVLIFAGTLAQTRLDIWVVINDWFRARVVDIPLEIFVAPFDKASYNEPLKEGGLTFRFPGGFTILGLLSINLCCAMTVKLKSDLSSRARATLIKRHIGIYTTHVGLLVMFAGEFVTGFYAQEGNLSIQVGAWSDFVEDHRKVELAFVDRSDPEKNRHVVIPQALLEKYSVVDGSGELIEHEDLPFDIRVEDYMPNAEFAPIGGEPNEALRGPGRYLLAKEIAPYPGTEGRKEDIPAAYITLLDKQTGKPLGTWLCTAVIDKLKTDPKLQFVINSAKEMATQSSDLEPVQLAMPMSVLQDTRPGMPELELRFTRRYLGYRVNLESVNHEVYDGTGIPHDFSSNVIVEAEPGTVDRKARIWMNNPMRYDDKAFFQRQMDAGADREGESGATVLQVVTNPGVWLPYISCGIVTLGLVMQFSFSLMKYTRRATA